MAEESAVDSDKEKAKSGLERLVDSAVIVALVAAISSIGLDFVASDETKMQDCNGLF